MAPPRLVAPSRCQGQRRSQIRRGRVLHPGGPVRQQKDTSLGARRGTGQGTERHRRCHQMAEVRRGAGAGGGGCRELENVQNEEHMTTVSLRDTWPIRARALAKGPFCHSRAKEKQLTSGLVQGLRVSWAAGVEWRRCPALDRSSLQLSPGYPIHRSPSLPHGKAPTSQPGRDRMEASIFVLLT